MDTKICGKCKPPKLLSSFNSNKTKKDGLQVQCRECQSETQKKWYKNHKVTHMKNVRERVKRCRREYAENIVKYLMQHPCVDCGEKDPLVLDFDHVRGTKTMNVSAIIRRLPSWSRVEAEIQKCEIRCANCHRKKSAKKRGDHRYKILKTLHTI